MAGSLYARLEDYVKLTKPRVVMLIVFTAFIGMLLAQHTLASLDILIVGSIGIWLVAGAAAAVNCLVEQKIDAVMARTRARPLPLGSVTVNETVAVSLVVGGVGLFLLYYWINPLTMWLTLGTFVGYAIIYTIVLKPLTPQNIVIGGASGAMPPILGWAAVTGEVTYEALLLFLIIFAWTPPHFWALALYRRDEYAKAEVPMLPVTHGEAFTRLHVFLYTLILLVVSLLPFAVGMSHWIYGLSALILGLIFVFYAYRIWRSYTDALARTTFKYSILYLALIFSALLLDHYLIL
ncbi:MAG: heme o synthase [Betaproteobacteria bacterium]|jgi:protoheme IX farnesyltransferase